MSDATSRRSETWIEHLGHTSFAVFRGETRLLIDPIVVREDLDFRRPTCPRWYYDDSSKIDGILISHGHNDHLHPPSLLAFPPDTPIYFMDEDPETCSCHPDEDPHHLLPNLGFHDVHPFRPGEVLEFGDDVKVHIVPAQASSEGEEQCCFVVETPDVLLLDAVDIKDDPETRAALEPFRSRLDFAYLPTGAAYQFQGFWNQMDAIEAIELCRWLEPKRVATCGGSVSLSERVRYDSLERYPQDLADWLTTAGDRLPAEQLFRQRPPCLLLFQEHELTRVTPKIRNRFEGRGDDWRPLAVVAAFFTGYHPETPSKRWTWPGDPLGPWLEGLAPIRDVIANSHTDLRRLLDRCLLEINHTPLARLAPCLLRRAVRAGSLDLAARLTAHIPPAGDAEALETSYFAVLHAILQSDEDLSAALRNELETCLWLDRRVFHLTLLAGRLRGLRNVPTELVPGLREQHREELRAHLDQRRPVLDPHPILLSRDQIPLLTDSELEDATHGMVAYANTEGVFFLQLTQIQCLILDLCDGRTFAEMTAALSELLGMDPDEVRDAATHCLIDLAERSILMIDWSH